MSQQHLSIVGLEATNLPDTTVKVIHGDQVLLNPPALIPKTTHPTTSTVVPPSKIQDVRVDNWGNYCLQRLQLMYERSDYCDLTLQFYNLQIIKVHRLVLNMCTDYFSNLERANGLTNGMLVLSQDMEFSAMLVIIKFIYTGKLEARGAHFKDIYHAVKQMNINILIKLLEAHARKPDEITKAKPAAGKLVLKTGGGGPQVLKSLMQSTLNAKTLPGIRKQLTMSRPLPAGVKTKTVLARVQQQPIRLAGLHSRTNIRNAQAPKKLPIWKERKTIVQTQDIKYQIPQKVEPARPTRFEWPDPEEEGAFRLVQNLPDEFPTQPLISSLPRNPSSVFDAVKIHVEGGPPSQKHKLPSEDEAALTNTAKMAKMSEDIERELASMEGSTTEEDMSNVLCEEVSDHTEVETSVEISTTEPMLSDNVVETVVSNEIVSSLKSTPAKKVLKSVRFAPDLEKENKEVEPVPLPVVQNPNPIVPIIECSTTMKEDQPPNHSKIISEVLKKYPELVRDNKSVKLKIVQKGPPEAGCKEGKSKVSYIVLKSSSDSVGSVVLKKSPSPTRSKFWDTEETVKKVVSSAAQNTLGPWTCIPCGSGDAPENFDSYYLYRKHLVEVHGEKVDARICEYCGYFASKRNLLLYHLYTKHSIEPPATYSFPHCDRCDYVALSISLLQKHKLAHDTAKELSCNVCRASFKTHSALQHHIAANLHRNRDSKGQHQCQYCPKQFARLANLNTHIRSLHHEVSEEMEDSLIGPEDVTSASDHSNSQQYHGQVVEVDGLISADGQHAEIINEMGGSITVPLSILPSSEAEALNNVASSIAASLGLGTQIHQTGDGYTEHILGDGTQQVFVLDNSSSEVGGVEISGDGTMLLGSVDAVDTDGQFLVQDIHGNKFRKITGTDSEGNPVVFFQLTDESEQVSNMGEDAVEISEDGTTSVVNHGNYAFDDKSSLSVQNDHMYLDPQKCSVFVSSAGGMPVTINSEGMGQTQLVTYTGDGTQVIELLPLTSVEAMEMESNAQAAHPAEDPSEVSIVSENDGEELSYPTNSGMAQEVSMEEISYEEEEVTEEELQEDGLMEMTHSSTLTIKTDDITDDEEDVVEGEGVELIGV